MPIGELDEIPETQDALDSWATNHWAHHLGIAQAIKRVFGNTLDVYALDPFPTKNPDNMAVWAEQHYQMHLAFATILGISSHDLSELEWEDKEQATKWFNDHYDEHAEAAARLKIG